MDYIQRMLNQVAKVLAAILGHRKAGDEALAEAEIEKAAVQTAGVPMSLIVQASPAGLRAFIGSGGAQRHSRDILLAELLLQQGEICQEQGRSEEMRRCQEHAFCLIMDAFELLVAEDAAIYREKLGRLAPYLRSQGSGEGDPYIAERLARFDALA